jgi:large subunit ribosomal protein L7/L12
MMCTPQTRLNLPEEFYTTGGLRGGGGGGRGGAAAGGAAAAAPEPVKVKDIFDIKLTEVDAKSKIKIIKEVRAITGLGLKEVSMFFIAHFHSSLHISHVPFPQRFSQAKEMVEGAPIVVKQGLKKEEAEKLLKTLIDAGAKAELL